MTKKLCKKNLDEILERIAKGESLSAICKDERMPVKSKVVELAVRDKEFGERYARVRDIQSEVLFDEILDTVKNTPAKGEDVQKARLLVDSQKWFLSKVKPRRFGDRLDLTSDGEKVRGVTFLPQKDGKVKE